MAVYLFLTFNQEQVQICYCNNHLLDYFTCKSHLYICPPSAIKLSGHATSHHHPLYADTCISTFCYINGQDLTQCVEFLDHSFSTYLGGFSTSSVSSNHHNLILFQFVQNHLPVLKNWQIFLV